MNVTSIQQQLLEQASAFIRQCYAELGKSEPDIRQRLDEISSQVQQHGHYTHTAEELTHGAKLAWRNSNRCIGRLFWDNLSVLDARHVETTDAMAETIWQHIDAATNGGKIRPFITVFPASNGHTAHSPRIWNHQLIRYAGYESNDGTIIGDPASVSFTRLCQELGWQGAGTSHDILPLVLSIGSSEKKWYAIPKELALEVPLAHPDFPTFEELGLRWYAVPFVSDMLLEIGGIRYTAAPFNGWYMGTEIGARNLADKDRYNKLPEVARVMGLDTSSNASLWKDKALVELNVAVLHSYKIHGVTIVDHHTAAQQFMRFERNERESSRDVTGRWSWLVPPLSPATTHIFHQRYDDRVVSPQFMYQNNS
ncbi:nitric oxide synthase oxygenase [Paenibacillus paeoniae]|uniref:Nitric oxide synthase oxygenase n=1 Tax=Paenibacillus paeoniae TaxID=2292705 RepID=A0A371PM16_9BACL|nr:nitric oxide synthase oxygenase [Paenibacillus paeoniae]REK77173.1 nitric oxide synthase [Paenibacillus paeoniae]